MKSIMVNMPFSLVSLSFSMVKPMITTPIGIAVGNKGKLKSRIIPLI
jgi:hypothetical protein